jgi:hypothetical protein
VSITVPIDAVERDLRSLLEQLQLGETITLVSSEGMPQAVLVSLKSAAVSPQSQSDWEMRWDALSRKVSQAWKSEKTALETLAEMRR